MASFEAVTVKVDERHHPVGHLLGPEREHLHHVVADEVPEVQEVRRVLVHLLERQVPVGAIQLPMMSEVAQRPFDRVPQDA